MEGSGGEVNGKGMQLLGSTYFKHIKSLSTPGRCFSRAIPVHPSHIVIVAAQRQQRYAHGFLWFSE